LEAAIKNFVNIMALVLGGVVLYLVYRQLKVNGPSLQPQIADNATVTIPFNLPQSFFDATGFTGFDPAVFLGGS